MDHFVAYHKVEEFGEYRTTGPEFSHFCRKGRTIFENAIGARVWVFTGKRMHGKMAYHLAATYTAKKIVGESLAGTGEAFLPPIEVTGMDWFERLLFDQGYFRFGMNRVYGTGKHLLALTAGVAPLLSLPDETLITAKYTEGPRCQVIVNAFERNRKARAACITYHGATCQVCGFDFEEVYGGIGNGFIHVHHIKDLATIRKKYVVDPVKDLVPVCANCHAMLHTATPAMDVKKLRAIVKRKKIAT